MSERLLFYVTRTLLWYRGPDLNRITLQMPSDKDFVLCEMGEARTDKQIQRWNDLAKELSLLWEAS